MERDLYRLCHHKRGMFNKTRWYATVVRASEMNRLLSRVTYEICDLYVMRRILRKSLALRGHSAVGYARTLRHKPVRKRFSITPLAEARLYNKQ